MGPVDYAILAVLVLILGGAAWYVWRSKKKGAKCIGCPDSQHCSGNCGNCSGCSCKNR